MVNMVGNQGEGTYFGDNESGRSGLITKLTCEEQIGNIFKSWEKIAKTGGLSIPMNTRTKSLQPA